MPTTPALSGAMVRLTNISVSLETSNLLDRLAAAMGRAGLPRAHTSGALDLLALEPEKARELLGDEAQR